MLKPVLMFTNLGFVALLQHVLGLGMAVALYVLMLRRVPLARRAGRGAGPARRVPAERGTDDHARRAVRGAAGGGDRAAAWQPRPALPLVILAGVALGTSAPVRQVGEALILPALVYVLAAARDWRTRLVQGVALTICFALPVVGYMGYSKVILHYGFQLSNMGDAYLYGRAATPPTAPR